MKKAFDYQTYIPYIFVKLFLNAGYIWSRNPMAEEGLRGGVQQY